MDLGYSLEYDVYARFMFLAKIIEISIIFFQLKIIIFTAVKNRNILHWCVIVMWSYSGDVWKQIRKI